MEMMRETRELVKKLGAVPTLGQKEEDEESASMWVSRMRSLDEEKKRAEERAKMLQEMEDEFGVEDLVTEALKEDKAQVFGRRGNGGLWQ